MKALKALVFVMTFLLVAGLATLGYGLFSKARQVSAGDEPPASFGEVRLAVPPGARLAEMATTGGRLVLRLEGGEGGGRILVLDPTSGAVTGSFVLAPAE